MMINVQLTSLAGGASVFHVALASTVNASAVHRAWDRAADDETSSGGGR